MKDTRQDTKSRPELKATRNELVFARPAKATKTARQADINHIEADVKHVEANINHMLDLLPTHCCRSHALHPTATAITSQSRG